MLRSLPEQEDPATLELALRGLAKLAPLTESHKFAEYFLDTKLSALFQAFWDVYNSGMRDLGFCPFSLSLSTPSTSIPFPHRFSTDTSSPS